MPLKRKTIIPSLVLLAVMVALLFCSKDYNPFADLTNAKVHVLSWSFADKDTVPLYSTGVLKLVVALHEEVDSFVLKVPKNRYWPDTTVRSGRATFDGGPYSFSISFYDTGMQEILIETHRSNGELVPQVIPMYVTSVLHQADINNLFGKPFTLSTPRVADNDVFYHWDFGPGRKDSSLLNTWVKTFYYFTPSRDTGRLWVTDLSGKNSTPRFSFVYSFKDTGKPIITCKNSGVFNGDTLTTGDTNLVFRVQIVDSGTEEVDSSSINGMPFETENSRDHIYTKMFDNLPVITQGNIPLKLTVFARDNPDVPNVAIRTFWVLFQEGGVKNSLAEVVILIPNSPNSAAGRRDYTITGQVKSYFATPKKLNLKMRVNGILMTDVQSFSDSGGYWVWPVYLGLPSNTIMVKVEDEEGDSLAAASRTILYNPNAKDTIDPMIYEIRDSADGKRLDNAGENVVYTEKAEMTLKIIAFDEGSGIHDISINGIPLQMSTQNNYLWYEHVTGIAHSAQGMKCIIHVTDNATNSSEKTITLIKNTPPLLQSSPEIPPVLCADSTYTFHLMYSDANNDPVTVLWRSKPGSMDTAKNGLITWRPTANDLGSDSVIIQGSDGYSYSERFLRTFTVENCKLRYPVHFITREQDFPGVLQAGRDTLSIRLLTDTVVPGLRYSARFLDRPQVISQLDSSATLVWSPVMADTGFRRLMVTVSAGDTVWDTISPSFWVVPKNQYPCSLSYRFTGTTTVNNELDLFSHPKAETLFFAIHDKDSPRTEKYTVSITQNRVKSVQVLDKSDFYIAVKPDSLLYLDTLHVAILDMTGTTDSAKFVIRYAAQRPNRKPVLLASPGFPAWFCTDSTYRYTIVPFDSDNDVVDVATILKPAGMTVSLRGVVEWTPAADTGDKSLTVRLFDGKDSSASSYSWILPVVNCATLPPGVKFQTKKGDFPAVLSVGDSIALRLSAVAGTGASPFHCSARFIDNGFAILSNSTDSQLVWKPSLADTGTRVLMVSVADRYNRKDSITAVIHVVPWANRKPVLLSGPAFPAWFCIDSSYRYTIVPFDSDNDVVDVETILKPAGMTVSLRGAITWTPAAADTGNKSLAVRFFDGKDYSVNTYNWLLPVVNCATLPPGVKFRTTPADFPSVLMVGDSLRLALSSVSGTGVAPFYYSARFIDNGSTILSNSTDSQLVWKPSLADTGTHVMMVSVVDRYNRKDSIMAVINVVPRNQYPCSLSYVYSGTTVSPGVMQIMYPAPPETFTFTIHDLDNPLTERYTVDIVKDRVRSTQTLAGATRSFTVTVSSSAVTTFDTIRVKIRDATGSTDSISAVVRYIGRYLLHLQLNTTALGAGVATNQVNFPVLVRLKKSNFDFSKALRNGQDIVCRKPDGVVLPHEIEQWDSSNGTAAVWVKVDTVFGNDSTHFINLNAGEDIGTSPSNPNTVFDTASAFCGVWHLNENPAAGTGAIKDRTRFGNNGTSYGTMTAADQVAGLIGNGMNFNGNNAYVSFGDINQVDSLTKLTASAWIKPSGLQDWASIIGKANDVVNEWEIIESGAGYNNNTNFQIAARNSGAFNTQCGYTTTNPISTGNWMFCVMVFDGTQPPVNFMRLKFYINGVQQTLTYSTGNIPDRLPATTWPVQVAKTTIGSGWFQGIMDEATVARDARSADWVKLCYMNQRAVDALVKFR